MLKPKLIQISARLQRRLSLHIRDKRDTLAFPSIPIRHHEQPLNTALRRKQILQFTLIAVLREVAYLHLPVVILPRGPPSSDPLHNIRSAAALLVSAALHRRGAVACDDGGFSGLGLDRLGALEGVVVASAVVAFDGIPAPGGGVATVFVRLAGHRGLEDDAGDAVHLGLDHVAKVAPVEASFDGFVLGCGHGGALDGGCRGDGL